MNDGFDRSLTMRDLIISALIALAALFLLVASAVVRADAAAPQTVGASDGVADRALAAEAWP